MDVLSFVAAMEAGGGGGVSQIKKQYDNGGTVGKVVQMLSNGTVADLPLQGYGLDQTTVRSGTSIAYDQKYTTVLPTSAPNVFIVFSTYSGATYLYVQAVRINADNTVTVGGIKTSNSFYNFQYSSMTRLGTADTWLFSYTNSSNYPRVCAMTIDLSTLTINFGVELQVQAATAYQNGVVGMDNNSAVLTYCDYATGNYKVVNVTVTGTTCSLGAVTNIASSQASNAGYDLTIYLIGGSQLLVRANGNFIGLTRSGTNFSIGIPVAVPNGTAGENINGQAYGGTTCMVYAEVLNSTQILYVQTTTNTAKYMYAMVVQVSGNTVTLGAQVVLRSPEASTNSVYINSVYNVGNGRRVIQFNAYTSVSSVYTYKHGMLSITISGMSIIPDNNMQYLFETSGASGYGVTAYAGEILPDNTMLIRVAVSINYGTLPQLYRVRQEADLTFNILSNSGTTLIGASMTQRAGSPPIYANGSYWLLACTNTSSDTGGIGVAIYRLSSWEKGRIWGIKQTTGEVLVIGVSNSHSGLNVGQKYYYDAWGRIVLGAYNPAGKTYLGRAISTTEIWMDTPIITDPA